MIRIKTNAEVELMRESALLVSSTLAELATMLKPGITTELLDKRAEEFILDHQAVPSFKNYRGYPFATCISVNDAVVHGFPNDKPLKEGDLVSIDVGVYKNGFHGDSAYSFAVGEVGEDKKKLLAVTLESLLKGIEKVRSGNRIGDVSFAIQQHAEKNGYGVVRELVGHGLGKSKDVSEAIAKAVEDAKKNLVRIPLSGQSVPHEQKGKFGGAAVYLMPASHGTGVIAGGAVRSVLESVGIHDVLSKSQGSSNPHNVVKATFDALLQMRSAVTVAKQRGISLEKVFKG